MGGRKGWDPNPVKIGAKVTWTMVCISIQIVLLSDGDKQCLYSRSDGWIYRLVSTARIYRGLGWSHCPALSVFTGDPNLGPFVNRRKKGSEFSRPARPSNDHLPRLVWQIEPDGESIWSLTIIFWCTLLRWEKTFANSSSEETRSNFDGWRYWQVGSDSST